MTIIFDLGGVYFYDGTARAMAVINKKYYIDENLLSKSFYGDEGILYRKNKITHDVFWDMAKKRWGIEHVETCELSQIWYDGYAPNDEVVELVLHLKLKGYEIFYMSGSTRERVVFLEEKYNFLKNFDDGVFSFDIGARKPELEHYLAVLSKTSNAPNNCIFIDDCKNNLLPAKGLGINTIHFSSSEKLHADLIKHGLLN